MPSNLHTTAIPADVLEKINHHLASAASLAESFVITRTPKERQSMLVLGQKSLSFVERAFEYAQQNPQFCPPFLDKNDFAVDLADARGLWGIRNLSQQIHEAIDDTSLVAGSEAYRAALLFYHSVQSAAAQDITGAKAIFEDLKTRFPHGRRKVSGGASEQEKVA